MITSDRNIFIGAHVTEKVKQAIIKESYKSKVSMSLLIFSILEDALVPDDENTNHK